MKDETNEDKLRRLIGHLPAHGTAPSPARDDAETGVPDDREVKFVVRMANALQHQCDELVEKVEELWASEDWLAFDDEERLASVLWAIQHDDPAWPAHMAAPGAVGRQPLWSDELTSTRQPDELTALRESQVRQPQQMQAKDAELDALRVRVIELATKHGIPPEDLYAVLGDS